MKPRHSPNGRFSAIERHPGETLYDYLVRCRAEMGGRIRLLEMVRDGQEMIYFDERARHRLHLIVLANGEAGFAMIGYLLLDWCGVSTNAAPTQMAALIGLCALLGALVSIAVIAMPDIPGVWMRAARRGFQRLMDWIVPSDDESAVRRLPACGDASRPESIDVIVEERVATYLEVETFFWRARWLFAQVVVIAGLFSYVQLSYGVSLLGVIEDAALVALVCLLGGALFVLAADLVSTSLARLGRWWRRR